MSEPVKLPQAQEAFIEVALEGADQVRSLIPKVVGYLLLFFGLMCVVINARGLLGTSQMIPMGRYNPAWDKLITAFRVDYVLGAAMGVLQIYAGFRALTYRQNAPKVVTIFAALSIATTIAPIAYQFAILGPALGPQGSALVGVRNIFVGLIALGWAITALALMTRPVARAACTNPF